MDSHSSKTRSLQSSSAYQNTPKTSSKDLELHPSSENKKMIIASSQNNPGNIDNDLINVVCSSSTTSLPPNSVSQSTNYSTHKSCSNGTSSNSVNCVPSGPLSASHYYSPILNTPQNLLRPLMTTQPPLYSPILAPQQHGVLLPHSSPVSDALRGIESLAVHSDVYKEVSQLSRLNNEHMDKSSTHNASKQPAASETSVKKLGSSTSSLSRHPSGSDHVLRGHIHDQQLMIEEYMRMFGEEVNHRNWSNEGGSNTTCNLLQSPGLPKNSLHQNANSINAHTYSDCRLDPSWNRYFTGSSSSNCITEVNHCDSNSITTQKSPVKDSCSTFNSTNYANAQSSENNTSRTAYEYQTMSTGQYVSLFTYIQPMNYQAQQDIRHEQKTSTGSRDGQHTQTHCVVNKESKESHSESASFAASTISQRATAFNSNSLTTEASNTSTTTAASGNGGNEVAPHVPSSESGNLSSVLQNSESSLQKISKSVVESSTKSNLDVNIPVTNRSCSGATVTSFDKHALVNSNARATEGASKKQAHKSGPVNHQSSNVNLFCLFCSSAVVGSPEQCSIDNLVTLPSNISVSDRLSFFMGYSLPRNMLPSSSICPKCFHMINEVDCLENRLKVCRRDVSLLIENMFQKNGIHFSPFKRFPRQQYVGSYQHHEMHGSTYQHFGCNGVPQNYNNCHMAYQNEAQTYPAFNHIYPMYNQGNQNYSMHSTQMYHSHAYQPNSNISNNHHAHYQHSQLSNTQNLQAHSSSSQHMNNMQEHPLVANNSHSNTAQHSSIQSQSSQLSSVQPQSSQHRTVLPHSSVHSQSSHQHPSSHHQLPQHSSSHQHHSSIQPQLTQQQNLHSHNAHLSSNHDHLNLNTKSQCTNKTLDRNPSHQIPEATHHSSCRQLVNLPHQGNDSLQRGSSGNSYPTVPKNDGINTHKHSSQSAQNIPLDLLRSQSLNGTISRPQGMQESVPLHCQVTSSVTPVSIPQNSSIHGNKNSNVTDENSSNQFCLSVSSNQEQEKQIPRSHITSINLQDVSCNGISHFESGNSKQSVSCQESISKVAPESKEVHHTLVQSGQVGDDMPQIPPVNKNEKEDSDHSDESLVLDDPSLALDLAVHNDPFMRHSMSTLFSCDHSTERIHSDLLDVENFTSTYTEDPSNHGLPDALEKDLQVSMKSVSSPEKGFLDFNDASMITDTWNNCKNSIAKISNGTKLTSVTIPDCDIDIEVCDSLIKSVSSSQNELDQPLSTQPESPENENESTRSLNEVKSDPNAHSANFVGPSCSSNAEDTLNNVSTDISAFIDSPDIPPHGPEILRNVQDATEYHKPTLLGKNFKAKKHAKLQICRQCDQVFSNRQALIRHIERRHKNIPTTYSCETCHKKFNSERLLKQHSQIHKTFACKRCNKVFLKKIRLKRHLEEHEQQNHSCEICGKETASMQALISHFKTHTKTAREFVCNLCSKKFTCKRNLLQHSLIHSGEMPHTCENCGKGFRSQSNMVNHYAGCSGKFRYICATCGKGFSLKSVYNLHVAEHEGKYEHNCFVCHKGFRKLNDLKYHFNTHGAHGHSRLNICVTCPATVSPNTDFNSTTRISANVCSTCGKSFKKKQALKDHMAIHTGTKQYKCNICSASYLYRSNLNFHVRTVHLQERSFTCNICHKTFSKPSNFKLHMRTHTGERPYQCQICGKAFSSSSNYKRHLKCHINSSSNEEGMHTYT